MDEFCGEITLHIKEQVGIQRQTNGKQSCSQHGIDVRRVADSPLGCGNRFRPKRSWQKQCSPRCRQRVYIKRQPMSSPPYYVPDFATNGRNSAASARSHATAATAATSPTLSACAPTRRDSALSRAPVTRTSGALLRTSRLTSVMIVI
jgi:hypothetical protein